MKILILFLIMFATTLHADPLKYLKIQVTEVEHNDKAHMDKVAVTFRNDTLGVNEWGDGQQSKEFFLSQFKEREGKVWVNLISEKNIDVRYAPNAKRDIINRIRKDGEAEELTEEEIEAEIEAEKATFKIPDISKSVTDLSKETEDTKYGYRKDLNIPKPKPEAKVIEEVITEP